MQQLAAAACSSSCSSHIPSTTKCLVGLVLGIPSWYTKYLVYQVFGIPSTWYTTYLVYHVLGIPSTWYTKYLVYQGLGIPSTWYTKYLVYHVLGIPSTIPSTWYTNSVSRTWYQVLFCGISYVLGGRVGMNNTFWGRCVNLTPPPPPPAPKWGKIPPYPHP